MCDCQSEVNQHLCAHNTRLSTAFSRVENRLVGRLIVATEKIDSRGKGRPLTVTPSYCPFCGEAIDGGANKIIPLSQGEAHV